MDENQISPIDLTGLVDLHIHSAPDVQPRWGDDLEVAAQARQAGMRAVLLKSHAAPTAGRAAIAEKATGGVRVFGGIALNAEVGGLNPAAVEAALRMGAKEVWMPTRSAAHGVGRAGEAGGIWVLDGSGRLRPEVVEIIDLAAAADGILATGHLAPGEAAVLVAEAVRRGVRKVLVTHPEAAFIRMPLEMQAALAGEGAFFERCFVDTTPLMGEKVSLEEIAHAIRTIGVHATVLSTDFGQVGNPAPVEGMRAYLAGLRKLGFSEAEIRKMAGETPAYLLGI
jgi:hypothetical protein